MIELPDCYFRELNKNVEQAFRAWARKMYEPHSEIIFMWHPVVRDECEKINAETGRKFSVIEGGKNGKS